jgi:hypothetical protein
MGITRTLIAWLVVLGLQLTPHVTCAEDGGPGREVRAIRHDLPILVAHRSALWKDTSPIVIDGVLVEGDGALAQWHQGAHTRIEIFSKQLQRWWLQSEISIDEQNGLATCCGGVYAPGDLNGPTTAFLQRLPDVAYPLASKAATFLPAVANANERASVRAASTNANATESPSIHGDTFVDDSIPLTATTTPWLGKTKAYALSTTFSANDATPQSRLTDLAGRAPTSAESWEARCGNGYFFFSATLSSQQPVHVSAGTKLDVWFPFVLAPKMTYSLTIAHVTPIIGPLNGTLTDNTLHFELPAFSAEPGADLMGEIDGDPFNC